MCGYFNRAWGGRSICCSCPHSANMADSLMAGARWQCRGTVTKRSHPQLFRLPSSHGINTPTEVRLCICCTLKAQGRVVRHIPICSRYYGVVSTGRSFQRIKAVTQLFGRCCSKHNLFLLHIHIWAAWGVNTGKNFLFMWFQDITRQRGAVLNNGLSCFLISPGVLPGKLRHSGVSQTGHGFCWKIIKHKKASACLRAEWV